MILDGPVGMDREHSLSGTWVDYNNDGLLDLFVVGTTAVSGDSPRHRLYRNLGGEFHSERFPAVGGCDADWGDFDNDGDFDVIVSRFANTPIGVQLFVNQGDGSFRSRTFVSTQTRQNFSSVAWADFDNDGHLDVFVERFMIEGNFLFKNKGDGTFEEMSVESPDGLPAATAWGDYNNDGFMDLYIANEDIDSENDVVSPVPNTLWKNKGNDNHWLKLVLEGRNSNRSAIGAKVRVKATIAGEEVWQLRQVAAGSSLWTQHDMRPNFGLGDATVAEVVRIEWPSGVVQEFTQVEADQTLEIIEASRLVAVGPGEIQMPVARGIRYRMESSGDLRRWQTAGEILTVHGNDSFVDLGNQSQPYRFYRAVEREKFDIPALDFPVEHLEFGGGVWVAVTAVNSGSIHVCSGTDLSLWSSANGTFWEKRFSDGGSRWPSDLVYFRGIWLLAFGGTERPSCENTLIASSSDGIEWRMHDLGDHGFIDSITYANGLWIAEGHETFISPDGENWMLEQP